MWQSVFPFGTHFGGRITFRRTDCHVALVLLAMTAETLETYATDQRFANSEVGWFLKCVYFPWHRTPRVLPPAMLKPRLRGAARRAHGSSAEHAMRDLIASNAPLRNGMHKARQNGPKHYPRGFKGIAIPLARLSPLSFAVQRKMGPTECVGMAERSVKTYHLNDETTDSP